VNRAAEQLAFGIGLLIAWGGYRLARAILREFDAALFKQAIERIPDSTREQIRTAWLAEEGLET
jgi:hypothetical protein